MKTFSSAISAISYIGTGVLLIALVLADNFLGRIDSSLSTSMAIYGSVAIVSVGVSIAHGWLFNRRHGSRVFRGVALVISMGIAAFTLFIYGYLGS